MNEQYEIPFKTTGGRDGLITITAPNWPADPVTLTGTAEPITTSLDDSDDLFTPVRRSTGYIRIVDDGNAPYILPTSAKGRGVTLTIDGTLMWQGYLKPETYKAQWDYLPTLEIPVVSGLGVLDMCPLPQEDITLRTGATLPVTYGSVRIARLILECIHLMGTTVNTIVFPATVSTSDGWGALGYRLSRWNYFKRNDDTNFDDEDWKPLEAQTALEVLTDICTFFGWTCQEWHDSLYFVEVGATDYAAVTYEQLIDYAKETSTPQVASVVLPSPLDLSTDYKLAGASNTIEHMQPARKVTMSVSSSDVSDLLGIREQELSLLSYHVQPTATRYGASAAKTYFSKNPLLLLYYYPYDGAWETEEVRENAGPVPIGSGGRGQVGSVGVVPGCYDRQELTDDKKRNWELSELGLYFRKSAYYNGSYYMPTATQALSMPAVIVKSPGVATFSEGYICISATAKSNGYGRYDASSTQNGRGDVKAQLKIGDKYWDGTAWVSSSAYFDIHVGLDDPDDHTTEGDGKIINTKTLRIDCESCDGQVIPITGYMSGDLLLTIPCLVQATGDHGSGNYDELGLINFSITYKPPVSKYYEDNDTRSYTAFTGADGDAVDIKASIASNQNTRPGYGLLMTASNVPVKQLTYSDNSEQRPEVRLITRMANHYADMRDKITVDVDPYQADGASVPNTDNPLTVVGHDGKDFAIIGREVNWRDWSQTLTLLEI